MSAHVVFIMLNPSTADASVDDPSSRRLTGFATAWGFQCNQRGAVISDCSRFRYLLTRGGYKIVNLYAYRTKSPAELKDKGWLIGPDNDRHIIETVTAPDAKMVIAAWGANAQAGRANDVVRMVRDAGRDLYHLGLSVGGIPKHPLYLKGNTIPTLWRNAEKAQP